MGAGRSARRGPPEVVVRHGSRPQRCRTGSRGRLRTSEGQDRAQNARPRRWGEATAIGSHRANRPPTLPSADRPPPRFLRSEIDAESVKGPAGLPGVGYPNVWSRWRGRLGFAGDPGGWPRSLARRSPTASRRRASTVRRPGAPSARAGGPLSQRAFLENALICSSAPIISGPVPIISGPNLRVCLLLAVRSAYYYRSARLPWLPYRTKPRRAGGRRCGADRPRP